MLKKVTFGIAMILVGVSVSFAQATDTPIRKTSPQPPKAKTTQTESKAKNSAAMSMLDTFNALLEGIRAINAKSVSDIYWKSPELIIFNSNGTVTKGWDQMSKNRESAYAKLKDVVLKERDVRATMLGQEGGIVNFLWTQSQTSDGVADSAGGRTTLVFRHIGNSWKIVHAHISPDSPDPSRVLQSEQAAPAATPAPTPGPKAKP